MPTDTPKKGADEFDGRNEILLGLLTAVDRDSNISQRRISSELGVALGLANAYLKRCVRKGWIKVQHVPRRRYIYYLSPQGFAEKTRLTAQYLGASFTFFRRIRSQLSELMQECCERGCHRIAFAGASDLAEVGTICAHDFDLEIVGIIDKERAGGRFCGLPVRDTVAACAPVDAVILTSLEQPQAVYRALVEEIGPDKVLVPPTLTSALSATVDDMEVVAAE